MNARRFLITATAVLVVASVVAQQKQGHASAPFKKNQGEMSVIDSTKLRVWYAMNADSLLDMNTYVDYQRLDVGDSISRYYSWFVFNSDSLIKEWRKQNPKAQSVPSWRGPGGKNKNLYIQYQYSDLYIQNGHLTEYACMPSRLERYNGQYTEEYPLQNWIISFEIQELLGYTCQKATCHFRGRDYVAWFAPDIPVRQGPWKLGGLPGLILKAHDTDSLYTFEAVKVETGKHPIICYEYKDYKEYPRTEIQKNQKRFTENWPKSVGWRKGTIMPDGSVKLSDEITSIHTPYEPLELE